ncbi:hypothetical protein M9980_07230 [Sphingomonas donggukensis]|uniref:Uncharacterized protein n=1 Tax=Sphingomonas donggukensis TaxID=2949093 RepID=A0ABY4TPT2_9SPHN|nr:hypothetical protein [Sphingomonas donggukensis]URW74387.1 hypothetical protein M9980_07230 [Sphingomonas donggukensis]
MTRPTSIVTFERVYLGAWALGVINTAMTWSVVQASPEVALATAQIGAWYVPTITAIGLLIPLLVWYFVARRGSAVAKWIMVVLTVIGVGGLAFSALMGRLPGTTAAIISIVTVALNVFAATQLFKPDTRVWFGETPVERA